MPAHQPPRDGAQVRLAGQGHGEFEFGIQHPHDAFDAGLAEGAEAPKGGAADQDGACAEGEGFQDVVTAAKAAIDQDGNAAGDGFDDLG